MRTTRGPPRPPCCLRLWARREGTADRTAEQVGAYLERPRCCSLSERVQMTHFLKSRMSLIFKNSRFAWPGMNGLLVFSSGPLAPSRPRNPISSAASRHF